MCKPIYDIQATIGTYLEIWFGLDQTDQLSYFEKIGSGNLITYPKDLKTYQTHINDIIFTGYLAILIGRSIVINHYLDKH